MKYSFIFGRNYQLVWALILPGIVGIIPLIILIQLSEKYTHESDLLLLLSVSFYLITTILGTLKWVKAIRVKVDIIIEKDVIRFSFPKKNIFHRHDFILSISEIVNTTEDYDKGYNLLYFSTKSLTESKFHLMAKADDELYMIFKNQLNSAIENFNQGLNLEEKIKHVSIYGRWPMKVLAIVFLIMWFAFPIASYFKDMHISFWTKYGFMVLISAPIIYKVYINNFRIR